MKALIRVIGVLSIVLTTLLCVIHSVALYFVGGAALFAVGLFMLFAKIEITKSESEDK